MASDREQVAEGVRHGDANAPQLPRRQRLAVPAAGVNRRPASYQLETMRGAVVEREVATRPIELDVPW